jgi:hypothetical protein
VVVIVDEDDVNAPPGDILNEFKSITLVTGTTAGIFTVVPGALLSDNFEVSYVLGKLTIQPAILNVKADDKVIFKGGSLPVFTSKITGYKNGDDIQIASGPEYTVSPEYNGLAGIYTINPNQLVFSTPNIDYSINYISGTLYVNPKGSGARKVKPYLDCVEVLNNHPSGYQYVAHFSYQNDNSTPVYVPIGADNNIVTSGTYSGLQPNLFLPGGGKFDIYFNGTMLTWTVKTYEVNLKTAVATEASSTSSRCSNNTLTSNMTMNVGKPLVANSKSGLTSTEANKLLDNIPSVYPNPVTDLVTIQWKNISDREVFITDLVGKTYKAKGIRKLSDNSIELNFSEFKTGVYLIKVKGDLQHKVLRIIKM